MAQLLQRSLGPVRMEGVPQPPPLGRQGLDGFPARPGLAGGGGAHQNHDPAASPPGLPYRLGQHPVMVAHHVSGQRPLLRWSRTSTPRSRTGRMDLQGVRLPLPSPPSLHRPVHVGRARLIFGPARLLRRGPL